MAVSSSLESTTLKDNGEASRPVRILILDDHTLVRKFTKDYLESESNREVSELGSASGALKLIREEGPFDCVLLDFCIPGHNGVNLAEKILAANDPNPVILFSGTIQPHMVFKLIDKGIRGYFPKSMSPSSLAKALDLIVSGDTYVPSDILIQDAGTLHPFDKLLSEREKNVLREICAGHPNAKISNELGLTLALTKAAVRNICRKLGAENRTHAALLATTSGWQ